MEDFVDIKGFEGKYKINRIGDVFSVKRERLLKPNLRKSTGYVEVHLSNLNKKKGLYSVHRLVAQTFIPNPNNFPQTDHINRIKTDNNVENLRWIDLSGSYRNRNMPKSNNLPVGVTLTPSNRYLSRISVNNKRIQLGIFDTIEEAELAYTDKYNELMDIY